jgi:hypothetical protein
MVDKCLQRLATLQLTEDIQVGGAYGLGWHQIENRTQLCVAGNSADAVQGSQIVVVAALVERE